MLKILRVDASARVEASVSRQLADSVIEAIKFNQRDVEVIKRDVGQNPPGFVSQDWIAAAFSKQRTQAQKELLRQSDQLIGEVRRADVILLSTPMYNYGMPASLKAWIDQVVRVNETFTFDLSRGDRPIEPTLSGKRVVALTSWGEFGFEAGGINEGGDNLVPHLRYVSRYLGVQDFHHIGVEYQEFGDVRYAQSKTAAFAAAQNLGAAIAKNT
ncbi:MAG: NAD(P)H-dependent oxidoreductase [Kordiimonadaceae bacterium]|nr:NAD(P)H-dependent oxidoreductase [Kordiimonadaceae bacterium]MBO6569217.1 NAD(P)H-dependent oxidoreductase [Kordiimonadaceae bacterium]MBO6964693.1 NAD(P)H-dependent oxidoreductase [Kordiimonadaceae bacterium]